MYEAEVARGAAWLDEHRPGWESRVDLCRLMMESCGECVLGQTFAEEGVGCSRDGFDYARTHLRVDALSHGFDVKIPGGSGNFEEWRGAYTRAYDALRDTWVALIKERHDNGTLSRLGVA